MNRLTPIAVTVVLFARTAALGAERAASETATARPPKDPVVLLDGVDTSGGMQHRSMWIPTEEEL
jgi:hypothetical protein